MQSLLRDLETFKKGHPDLTEDESVTKICNEWKGYANVYGEEFIRRTFRIVENQGRNYTRYEQ